MQYNYTSCQHSIVIDDSITHYKLFNMFLQLYRTSLASPTTIDATIELLEHTTKLIEVFLSRRPLVTLSDSRLADLRTCHTYFNQWLDVSAEKSFTAQTRFDLLCTIAGSIELFTKCCRNRRILTPGVINSDVIENHFCMIRGLFNGASDHPNYFTYKSLQQCVILTQPVGLPGSRNAHSTYVSC